MAKGMVEHFIFEIKHYNKVCSEKIDKGFADDVLDS